MMRVLPTNPQKIRSWNFGSRTSHTIKDTKPIHPSTRGTLSKWQEKKVSTAKRNPNPKA